MDDTSNIDEMERYLLKCLAEIQQRYERDAAPIRRQLRVLARARNDARSMSLALEEYLRLDQLALEEYLRLDQGIPNLSTPPDA